MKHVKPILLIILLTISLISTATAETSCKTDESNFGHCSKMRHKGDSMMHGPGLMKGIGGITLKEIMQLDLSDAQKKQVANILSAYRDDSRKMTDRMMAGKKDFFDIVTSKKAKDETAVRQSFQKMSTIMEDFVVLKTRMMSELKPVLNKEQFKSIMPHQQKKSDKKDKMKKMKKQRGVHREMMDTWINTYAEIPAS